MAFGERLQEVRRAAGLTQEQFAEELNVSRQAVSRWESCRGYPEMEKLLYLCNRYGVTLNADRVKQALEGEQSGIVLVDDMEVGLKVADAYAAEHLEVHTADAAALADRVTNAGAIFVGNFSPVPLGDYSAGSNHVLPTSGTARHSSGLSTHTFLKAVHVVEYDEAALKGVADTVVALADAERLPAHGEAIRARFEDLSAPEENR